MMFDTHAAREQMISQQLRPWGILDEQILNAVRQVAREQFVPDGYQSIAFADQNIPLPHAQVMLAPKLEARILQEMRIQSTDQVLLIGASNGHLAACAAQLAAKVRVTETHRDLADQARRNLQATTSNNVYVDNVDALQLNLDKAYDVIIVIGSLPQPEARFEQALTLGGRLFVVIGQSPVMAAMKITRTGEQTWTRTTLFETDIPPLSNTATPSKFLF